MTDATQSQKTLEAQVADLVKQIPTRSPIYLPSEKVSLADQYIGLTHVKRIYDTDLDAIYQPRMQALRAQYKGTKRCFLIGNGPSLNLTDLDMLKNEVTFAVNGFFLKARDLTWTPTFYCVEDHLVAEDRAHWIRRFKGPIKFFPAYLGYAFGPAEDTIFYNHRPRISYPDGFDFSLEADKITYTGCTVTFSMLQLAAYLGFEEIYLIGVDADYAIPADAKQSTDYSTGVLDMKSDDPNHFDPDYFGKGFRWHDPQVNKMVEAYAEARRTLEAHTDQRIYNATVGGKLEVFERRSFASLFPKARSPEVMQGLADAAAETDRGPAVEPIAFSAPNIAPVIDHPRLLVLDMTAMGNGTATGEVKSNLLRDWPAGRLLQVSSPRPETLALVRRAEDGSYVEQPCDMDQIRAEIASFDPQAILYRPLADRPHLHQFAMNEIGQRSNVALITWIMDDWPARLQVEAPERSGALDRDLRRLLARSALRLSISQAMSDAFEARYGVPFEHFANGIDPDAWDRPRHHKNGGIVVRYAGGIAPDMNAASLQRVAQAIELRAKATQPVRFEINTRTHWIKQSGALFEGLSATTLSATMRSPQEYIRWLCEADVLLIAYNFDPDSLRYVQYSMANKTPECLASGAALLVHGPRDVATVDLLAEAGVAELVDTPQVDALAAAIRQLSARPHREMLAKASRTMALSQYDLTAMNDRFGRAIAGATQAVRDRKPAQASAAAQPLNIAGFYLRDVWGRAEDGFQPATLADVNAFVATGPPEPGNLALIYADPCATISAAMDNGGDPLAALADWTHEIRTHLVIARAAKEACFFLPIGGAAQWPQHLPMPPLPATGGPLSQAIAALYLLRDEEALRFLAELKAGRAGAFPDPESARAALRDLLARPVAAPPHEAPVADQQAELHLAQEQVKQLRATAEVYHADAEALRAELRRIEQSKSWRLTKPLRRLRRTVTHSGG